MKKIIWSIFLSGMFTFIHAQTEKGDWIVGGRVQINTGENSTHIGFSPGAGLFVINNLAVGGELLIDHNKSGDDKVTSFGIGPLVRYYFTTAKVRPFLHAAVNFISLKLKGPGFSSSNTGTNLFLGGGAAIFINENVSLEPVMGYLNTKYKDFEGSGGFSFSLGFQVYINRGQVESLKGN